MSMNATLAMITGIVASPSSPSVRFTALPNATIMNAANSGCRTSPDRDDMPVEERHVEAACRSARRSSSRDARDEEFAAAAASARHARGARLADLVVIVEEADRAEAERHEQARPDERVAQVHPQQDRTASALVRIISPPIVGVPRLARWVCGPSSRIGWPLPWRTRSQPMNLGPMISPISSAVATAPPVRKDW